MKWLCVLLLLTSPALADIDRRAARSEARCCREAVPSGLLDEIDEAIYTAKVQTGAGIALSILGTALGGGGIGATTSDQKGHYSAALGLGISAFVLCAVGIPLAIVGADKAKSLEKKRLAQSLTGTFSF